MTQNSGRSLHGQIALIVGGLAPGGQAIARRLGREGALVVLADFDDGETADLAEKMTSEGLMAQGIGLDATSPESVGAAFDLIEQTYGLPSVLIYGIGFHMPFSSIRHSPDQWRLGLMSNLGGAGFCASEFCDRLLASSRPRGTILFLLSDLGEECGDVLAEVTREGLKALARTFHTEGRNLRLLSTVIQCGPLPNSGGERALRFIARERGVDWSEFSAEWRARNSGRISTDPTALAETVLQLVHGERLGVNDFLLQVPSAWGY